MITTFEAYVEKQTINTKRRARKLALQALYQWSMSGHDLYEIETQFHVANNMAKVDVEYFRKILYGVPKNLSEIEQNILPHLDRTLDQLNPVELSALRLGAFELLHCPEIPWRVILDESVNLTKAFGSQDGHRYVNGVLNSLARKVRAVEIKANE